MKKVLSILLLVAITIGSLNLMSLSAFAEEVDIADEGAVVEVAPSGESSARIINISAGQYMSAAIKSDGTLWTWGTKKSNIISSSSALGLCAGTSLCDTPMMVFSESSRLVNCGEFHDSYLGNGWYQPTIAVLKKDDSLWMWGGDNYGVLGRGGESHLYERRPAKVLDDVVSFDTSGYHSAAVTADGSLYVWGYNAYGQLGNGETVDVYSPLKAMDEVAAVSLGGYFSAAVKKDGSLWTWGRNDKGQLGNGTNVDSLTPVNVLNDVVSFSAGMYHMLAVTKDGSVYTWGCNDNGQLGLGDTITRKSPTLNDNLDEMSQVEAGGYHSAFLSENGALYICGKNNCGQLGDETTGRVKPRKIMSNVAQVSLGEYYSLALSRDGSLWAWGENGNGQLGDHTTTNRFTPTQIYLGRINASFQGGGMSEAKTLDIPWDDSYLYDSSTDYNKDMAICGVVLSEAAYKSDPSKVFEQFGYSTAARGASNEVRPGYFVGYKVTWDFDNPHVQIIMAIKGTSDDSDTSINLRSVVDSFDNAGNNLIDALGKAEETIVNQVKSYGISLTNKNTKYFITGHSLGGACAGKVGLMLIDNGLAFNRNLYVYTYASPTFNTDPFQSHSVDRLYNVINTWDKIVPNVPKKMYNGWIWINSWRAGFDMYYKPMDSDSLFINSLYNLYGYLPAHRYYSGPLPGDNTESWCAHNTPMYLAALLSTETQSSVNKIFSRTRVLSVHSPADVEVFDENGNLCAYTENGNVEYTPYATVIIYNIDGEKYVQIPDDREYTIRYTGTDTGTMRVDDQIYDTESDEIISEKSFENVALTVGKTFASDINAENDAEDTELYVVDEEGDKTFSVNEEGKETKLALYELNPKGVHINAPDQQYDGTEKTAEVTVDGLTEGEDYRIIYENNTSVGTATVTVKGINLFEGRVSETFEIYDEGSCTDNIAWNLSADGVLTLSGTGEMDNYSGEESQSAPWYDHLASIQKIVIEDGITSIGNSAFEGCSKLTEATIPSSVKTIGDKAFNGCGALESIAYSGTADDWESITIGDDNTPLQNAEKNYSFTPTTYILGDVDDDGEAGVIDATYIQRYNAGFNIPISEEIILLCGDVDGDGEAGVIDATFIQRYNAGFNIPYNIGNPVS